jgi:hypothetical protein
MNLYAGQTRRIQLGETSWIEHTPGRLGREHGSHIAAAGQRVRRNDARVSRTAAGAAVRAPKGSGSSAEGSRDEFCRQPPSVSASSGHYAEETR